MATEIVMPQMGAEMEEGTVVRWIKQPGDHVSRGESIAEIETDKATVDLESFEEGYFLGPVVAEGTTVPVGTVVAYLGAQGEPLPVGAAPAATEQRPEPAPPSGAATPSQAATEESATRPVGQPAAQATEAQPLATAPAAPPRSQATMPPAPEAAPQPAQPARPGGNGAGAATTPPPAVTPTPAGGRLRASPVARSIAQELGIDLGRVRGSGPDGRIMRRDVEEFARTQGQMPAAAVAATAKAVEPAPAAVEPEAKAPVPAAPPPAPPPPAERPPQPVAPPAAGHIEPLSRMRQAIARRMAAAKREMPHYYVTMDVDMTEAAALRRQLNASLPENERVSVNDLIVKACALALEKYPRFNAAFTEQGLMMREAINVGIAVALPDGLVAPAVLNCRDKSLGAISREARDLAERARSGHLRPAELSEGTFTVSNLGMYGVATLIAIIQPDQSAILGVGKSEPRPVVRDGEIVIREMMTIALSADHRVTDGAEGARFTAEIKDLLEHPIRLVL